MKGYDNLSCLSHLACQFHFFSTSLKKQTLTYHLVIHLFTQSVFLQIIIQFLHYQNK